MPVVLLKPITSKLICYMFQRQYLCKFLGNFPEQKHPDLPKTVKKKNRWITTDPKPTSLTVSVGPLTFFLF